MLKEVQLDGRGFIVVWVGGFECLSTKDPTVYRRMGILGRE